MSKKHKKQHLPKYNPSNMAAAPTSGGGESNELNFKKILGVFLLLAVASVIAYSNSFHNPFIWDDLYLIIDNHLIKDFRYLPELFYRHLYYSTAGLSNFYRPMQSLLVMFDYFVWKLNPFGYHLSSFLVHLACCYSAFWLIFLISRRAWVSGLSALLFLIHPINSTVVDYISSRADSQAALFMILSVILFIKAFDLAGQLQKRLNISFYTGSMFCFIIALLSKEMAISVPFLIAAVCFVLGKKKAIVFSLPYFLIIGIYAYLRLTVLHFQEPTLIHAPALGIRLLTSAEAFLRLIGIIFIPKGIHIEKGLAFSSGFLQPSSLISVMGLMLIAASVFWLGRRSLMYRFGWVWFFVAMLPMSNIVPINTTMADHWMYLPSVGFFAAFVGGTSDFIMSRQEALRGALKKLFTLLYIGIIVALIFLTLKQNRIWANPEDFFKLAIDSNPKTFRAHNELGVLYLNKQQLVLAEEEFRKAVEKNPKFDQAYDNLGVSLDYQGKFDEAIKAHKRAVELNPYNPKSYNNLGNAYFKTEQWDLAIEAYSMALKFNPNFKGVYNNLGAVYFRKGDLEKAREYWQRALDIDPSLETAASNLKALEKFEEKR
jgi:protein O-mannosyl-transferase